jgi:hypothetical protein
LQELYSGLRGKPYNQLIQHHVRKQNAKQIEQAMAAEWTTLPEEVRPIAHHIGSFFNVPRMNPQFWKWDAADVLDNITSTAHTRLTDDNLSYDENVLFGIFQIVTLNFAGPASNDSAMRRYMGIKKGLFS